MNNHKMNAGVTGEFTRNGTPLGYTTLTPFIAVNSPAEAIAFYEAVFGAKAKDVTEIGEEGNKIIVHGRRAGEADHSPPDAAVWYRIADTRTRGFIGDGFDLEEDAVRECRRLNAVSSPKSWHA